MFKSLPFCLHFQGEELKEAVKSEFFPWLSQYLVMKRVSIEPNFHDLYIKFMETLKWKELFQLVLQETYRNIKVLKAVSRIAKGTAQHGRGFSLAIAPLLPQCRIKDGWDLIMFRTAGLIFFHVFRFYSSRTKCLQISRIDRC